MGERRWSGTIFYLFFIGITHSQEFLIGIHACPEESFSLKSISFLLRGEMEGVDCVVPDVVCDDLAAEGNITSPLPSGDTFQVKHSLIKEINESAVRNQESSPNT